MRRLSACLVSLFALACGSSSETNPIDPGPGGGSSPAGSGGGVPTTGAGGTGGTGAPLDFDDSDDFDENATGDDALSPTITQPVRLAPDTGGLVGITSDDRIVYTTSDGLFSVKAASGAPPRKAASKTGNTHIKGRTIFNFADVDYQTGLGWLSYWTPAVGRRSIGTAMIGSDRVAARHDAAYMMFVRNVQPETVDVVIASADRQSAQVLIEGAGRGNEQTCSWSFGFAGDAAIVSWCELGSLKATLSRFTVGPDGAWAREDISTEAQGPWSSDALGQRLFYVATGGEARVTDFANEQTIGDAVSWGMMLPNGSAVFFTVGDQLRRSEMSGSAIPIVVDGFGQSTAWTPDHDHVLYSNEVVYEGGEKRNLYASTTSWFNPTPTELVAEPKATLARSVLTADGTHVLYFTDVTDRGGTLHVRPLNGGPGSTYPLVDTAIAAADEKIVITDNRDPNVYPVVADMKTLTPGAPPVLLEAGIANGRDIQIRADGSVVAYTRTGEEGGLWVRPIP